MAVTIAIIKKAKNPESRRDITDFPGANGKPEMDIQTPVKILRPHEKIPLTRDEHQGQV